MKTKSKFWIIAKRDYLQIVKSKGFIIGTFLVPIFWVIVVVFPGLLTAIFFEKTELKMAILDRTTKGVGKEIVAIEPNVFFLTSDPEEKLNEKLLGDELDAYTVIDDKNIQDNFVRIYTKEGTGLGLTTKVEKVFEKVFRKNILKENGLDTTLIYRIEKDLKVETQKITPKGFQKDYSAFYSVFGYFAGIILFSIIFLYSGFVMRGVVEEKANRIIEILLSSARPFDIMWGKIIGLASVGLTQIFIWVVLLSLLSLFSTQIISIFFAPDPVAKDMASQFGTQTPRLENFEIPPIPFQIVAFFVIYFLLGYFLISSIYAGLGAAVDLEQDAQALSTPINLLFIFPIFLIGIAIGNPNGTFATILSLFPPYTPILMIARMSATNVPYWQLILSVLLMLLTIWLTVKFSAKIYRVGVLIYGKKPTLKEIFRWLRQA